MATETKTITRITNVKRGGSSRFGNPRFLLTFADGTESPTQPDAMIAYGITNREYVENPVEVTRNGRGHVTYVRVIDPEEAGELDL